MICSFWSSMLILASAGSLCCTIRDVFGLSIRHEAGGQHLRWILLSVFLRLLRKSLLFLYVVFMQIPLSFYPQMLFPNPQPPQFLNPRYSFQNPSLLNFFPCSLYFLTALSHFTLFTKHIAATRQIYFIVITKDLSVINAFPPASS